MTRLAALAVALAVLPAALQPQQKPEGGHAPVVNLRDIRLVDLTHDLGATTLAWPGSRSAFRLDTISAGRNAQGGYAALFALSLPEHFGTHLDAPHHFDEHGASTAQVPLWRLMAPAVVIDITDSTRTNPDYVLTVADVERDEADHGRIPDDAIVLLRTGYAHWWDDRAHYFGWDSTVTPVALHFPGFGVEAATLLTTQRKVAAVGTDAASTDAGQAATFPVHRLLAEAGLPAFENLADLRELPARGAFIIALPPKIVGGSGGPLRVVAIVPRTAAIGGRRQQQSAREPPRARRRRPRGTT